MKTISLSWNYCFLPNEKKNNKWIPKKRNCNITCRACLNNLKAPFEVANVSIHAHIFSVRSIPFLCFISLRGGLSKWSTVLVRFPIEMIVHMTRVKRAKMGYTFGLEKICQLFLLLLILRLKIIFKAHNWARFKELLYQKDY